jgi:hypothetical protein
MDRKGICWEGNMDKKLWLGVIALVFVFTFHIVTPTRADTITVDTRDDTLDAAADCASVTIGALPGPDGLTSLREGICASNNHTGPDTIQFNLSVCFGPCSISPDTPLPIITDDGTIIDGYSDPDASEATDSSPAVLVVEINGENVTGPLANGLAITSANNQVRGLVINNYDINGIAIAGESAINNIIAGNHIGTDADGELDMSNGADGVYIGLGASSNTIGGDESADRNVISGNGWEGVGIHANGTTNNTVSGNYIGLDAHGVGDLGNHLHGVRIYGGAANNTIGGETYGERNIISENFEDGIRIVGVGTNGNIVFNNYIGTDKSGSLDKGNANGIYIGDGAQNNIIGQDLVFGWNVISNNSWDGVHITDSGTSGNVVVNNLIGTDYSGLFRNANLRDGVRITNGAQGNLVGGIILDEGNVISGNDDNGITISGAETMSNTVSANYIGVDANGSDGLGNRLYGVHITDDAKYNIIGGLASGERNIISANEYGVYIEGSATSSNSVIGNYIGTNVNGFFAVGNAESGVRITGRAHDNMIGGSLQGNGNVISGNHANGVLIDGDETRTNIVDGNTIGVKPDEKTVLGNDDHGVAIMDQAHHNVVTNNLIGGNSLNGIYITGPNASGIWVEDNIIGAYYDGVDLIPIGNGRHGVHIETADVIYCHIINNNIAQNAFDGVYVNGVGIIRIMILGNEIYHNNMGIRLLDGANGGIGPPTITGTTQGSVLVHGTACPDCRVEIFGNDSTENEGEHFLGHTLSDSSGNFSASLLYIPQPYIYLTATATDDDRGTSEFSDIYMATVTGEIVFLPMILFNP